MIEIEIDGKKYQAEPGDMIIEVADANHIPIPRFCYHKKLSIAANCRMCLVEVEKSGKPLPACATPVTAGMKIYTQSAKALEAQRTVMEFLLINHPLDCPICDQGGECELQDVSMGYGRSDSFYSEGKRVVKDKDIGPLIATDMTRCIHCTRCVRFGQEVAGLRELGATGRGEHMEIGTYVEHSVASELSGNIVDLCPVGALTSKPFRFRARAWELTQHPSIAPHDCIGSHLYLHTRRDEVMRVVPRENENINETWISDRDRYSYLGLRATDRLNTPMIKKQGQWDTVDWTTALNFIVAQWKAIPPAQMGALIHPSSTLEECYLLQKLMRGLGTSHIDHRIRELQWADQSHSALFPGLPYPFQDLEKHDVILLVGTDLHREQPLAAHRVRKAVLQGAVAMEINPVEVDYHFPLKEKQIVHPALIGHVLARLAQALLAGVEKNTLPAAILSLLKAHTPGAHDEAMAAQLKRARKATIILGAWVNQHPEASTLRTLAHVVGLLSGASVGIFTEGANTAGAWIAGALPHRGPAGMALPRTGYGMAEMIEKKLKAYVLVNIEPTLDCANAGQVMAALSHATSVVALTPYRSESLLEVAQVLLPIAPFSEISGTFVNVEGQWQSFSPATSLWEESKPGWKVLRVLGNLTEQPGFDYTTSEAVRDELQQQLTQNPFSAPTPVYEKCGLGGGVPTGLIRLTVWPIYRGDSLVRRADALQNSATAHVPEIKIHPNTAIQQGLKDRQPAYVIQDQHSILLPVCLDPRIPEGVVLIPAGFEETAALPRTAGAVTVKAVS